MATITASMVAELRAKTDAPMMECKKALTESEGDMVKAEEILRVKLGSKAGKAASRVTAEGVVFAHMSGQTGALIEVNCETDFVTKNDSFLALAQGAAKLLAQHKPESLEALSALAYTQDGFGPTLEDVSQILRVLARSATGQEMSVYTTFSTGPRRATDVDGPENYHVVLLDNGRSSMLGTDFQDMLRCIRCGACMNHCPVYHAVGGHAYGWVYPGPMGAVLTPTLLGVDKAGHLPNASTFCGRCESVCPVRIPLPKMMRHWREAEFSRHLTPATQRFGLAFWAFFAKRPALYKTLTPWLMSLMHLLGRDKGYLRALPLASGWTDSRDFPTPQGGTFQSLYRKQKSNGRAA